MDIIEFPMHRIKYVRERERERERENVNQYTSGGISRIEEQVYRWHPQHLEDPSCLEIRAAMHPSMQPRHSTRIILCTRKFSTKFGHSG